MRQTDISTELISSHYVVYDLTFILVDGGNSGGVTGCKNASEHSEVWKPLDILIGDVGTPPKLKHGLSPMVFVLEPNQVLTNFVFHGHKIPSGVYLRLIFFYTPVDQQVCNRFTQWMRHTGTLAPFLSAFTSSWTKWLNKLTSGVKGKLLRRQEWK